MRYVDGGDLRGLLRRDSPLPPARALAIVGHAAAGLDAAHRRGLDCHRDVKPGNILIGEDDHVYVSDFGLTKQASSQSGLTATGQFVGTVDYVAPEQIQGQPVDGRADVYALTCVLYEALVGAPNRSKGTPRWRRSGRTSRTAGPWQRMAVLVVLGDDLMAVFGFDPQHATLLRGGEQLARPLPASSSSGISALSVSGWPKRLRPTVVAGDHALQIGACSSTRTYTGRPARRQRADGSPDSRASMLSRLMLTKWLQAT